MQARWEDDRCILRNIGAKTADVVAIDNSWSYCSVVLLESRPVALATDSYNTCYLCSLTVGMIP